MIELDEAQRFVFDSIRPLPPASCAIEDVNGCVVADAVTAKEAVPGFINSSMDGFALSAKDTLSGNVDLRVVATIHAGDVAPRRLEPGQAMRIMTGAPLPAGADCVLMIEEAVTEGDVVTVSRSVERGEFVRQIGDDIDVGQVLFEPGDELSAPGIGVLAGQGFTSVLVHPRPRVGVLSTGNEVVGGSDDLQPGQIRDLNRPLLLALLEQSGVTPIDLGIVRDTRIAISDALRHGVDTCDAVISTGGVSVGDVDFVKTVIGDLGGGDARWMQVAIKPAKPFAFGVVGATHTPIFGLPGNPVSTRVSFELFVRPALRRLAGHRVVERLTLDAVLDRPIDRPSDGKLHLVHVDARLRDDGCVHVEGSTRRGSHLLNAIVKANAIALVPVGAATGIGDTVRVIVIDPDSLVAT